VARQTRLREEARARMAAKFGNSGMGGGGGGGGGRMQGIGSDPNYNPNGNNGGGDFDVNSLVTGFGSILGSAVSTAKSLADENTVRAIKTTGASFWGGLTSTVSQAASTITAPDAGGADGLADLQRQVAAQKPSVSKYSGFGSTAAAAPAAGQRSMSAPSSGNSGVQEAPGLPGEDRNGVGRLTGETNDQYVARQTRLRDEARARMAAKFGGGGSSLGGVGSSAPTPPAANRFGSSSMSPSISGGSTGSNGSGGMQEAPGLPGEDRNGLALLTGESDAQYLVRQTRIKEEARARMAAKFGGGSLGGVGSAPSSGGYRGTSGGSHSAPPSGNAPMMSSSTPPPNRSLTPPKKPPVMSSGDFFSSFGA
jgi:hypothetical protein